MEILFVTSVEKYTLTYHKITHEKVNILRRNCITDNEFSTLHSMIIFMQTHFGFFFCLPVFCVGMGCVHFYVDCKNVFADKTNLPFVCGVTY